MRRRARFVFASTGRQSTTKRVDSTLLWMLPLCIACLSLLYVRRSFGWIFRCLSNLHLWTALTWLSCRPAGANALTESHKVSSSSSLRDKVYTLPVLQPLRGMYRELRRRFVMAGHVEKEFVASNGVIQGCRLNVLLLNLDDAGVLTKTLKITCRSATVTQQKRNVDKTKFWGTTETALQYVRNLDLNGEQLLKSLGIQLRCARCCG